MDWSATEAKARFSELLRKSRDEVQRIRSRGRLAAVVMSPSTYEALCEATDRPAGGAAVHVFLEQLERLKAQWGGVDQLDLPAREEVGPPPQLGADDSRCT